MNDDLLNDFLLEAFPNPERNGCPDDETLRAFAGDRLPAGSPVLSHIASCSECYREYRHYRQDWKQSSSNVTIATKLAPTSEPIPAAAQMQDERPAPTETTTMRGWAIAAGVVIAVLASGAFFATKHHAPAPPGPTVASTAGPVNADVNLFNAVTVRGGGDQSNPLEQVSLPSSVIHLAVTLPRFSQSGPYEILVSKDRAGKDVVARGLGNAVEADKKVSLIVTLDLRNTAPGMYFLGTVRGSDNGTYYYPLRVN